MYGQNIATKHDYVVKIYKDVEFRLRSGSIKNLYRCVKQVKKFEVDYVNHMSISYLLELNGFSEFHEYFEACAGGFKHGTIAKAASKFSIPQVRFAQIVRKYLRIERKLYEIHETTPKELHFGY